MAGRRRAPGDTVATVQWIALAAVLLGLVLVGLRFIPGSPFASDDDTGPGPTAAGVPGQTGTPRPASRDSRPTPTPELSPLPVAPADVKIRATGWWSWSLLDTRTGKIYGSANQDETSTTASMIKAWISADYLRQVAADGRQPDQRHLDMITQVIRDSHNEYAEAIYNEVGRASSIRRLISICKLTDSSVSPSGGWSRTALSARDTARMGACIADGRAAGPKWTKWLLNEMRQVRGLGNFGIRKAFPSDVQKTIAIKNGWVDRTAEQEYHVSCMAIGDGWTMGVLTRYPIGLDYAYGAKTCEEVARQLRADRAE
jgi:hypothetical protein